MTRLTLSRQDLSEQLDDEEESSAEMTEAKKKLEAEINDLKQDVEDLETALKKVGHGIYYEKTTQNAKISASVIFCLSFVFIRKEVPGLLLL